MIQITSDDVPELVTPDVPVTKRDLFNAVSELMFAMGIHVTTRVSAEYRLANLLNGTED